MTTETKKEFRCNCGETFRNEYLLRVHEFATAHCIRDMAALMNKVNAKAAKRQDVSK